MERSPEIEANVENRFDTAPMHSLGIYYIYHPTDTFWSVHLTLLMGKILHKWINALSHLWHSSFCWISASMENNYNPVIPEHLEHS